MSDESEIKGETKSAKFRRLAESRVNNAIEKIRLVGNLANPQYEYTADEVNKIIAALQTAIAETEEKFRKTIERQRIKFQL